MFCLPLLRHTLVTVMRLQLKTVLIIIMSMSIYTHIISWWVYYLPSNLAKKIIGVLSTWSCAGWSLAPWLCKAFACMFVAHLPRVRERRREKECHTVCALVYLLERDINRNTARDRKAQKRQHVSRKFYLWPSSMSFPGAPRSTATGTAERRSILGSIVCLQVSFTAVRVDWPALAS